MVPFSRDISLSHLGREGEFELEEEVRSAYSTFSGYFHTTDRAGMRVF